MIGNILKYTCAKTYQNWARIDKVIRKIIWCSFFAPHGTSHCVPGSTCFRLQRLATRRHAFPPVTLTLIWWPSYMNLTLSPEAAPVYTKKLTFYVEAFERALQTDRQMCTFLLHSYMHVASYCHVVLTLWTSVTGGWTMKIGAHTSQCYVHGMSTDVRLTSTRPTLPLICRLVLRVLRATQLSRLGLQEALSVVCTS